MENKEQIKDKCPTCKHEKSFQFCSSGFHKEQNTGMSLAVAVSRYPFYSEELDLPKHFNADDLAEAEQKAFVAGASWQSSQPINGGWVSVETPPKDGSDVWIVQDGKVMLSYYWDFCDRLVYMYNDQEIKPSHWMYLITPSLPKQ
jgi:hypothetical protein